MAITELGNGLCATNQDSDALPVREVELSMMRRLGTPEDILVVQSNLGITYEALGRVEEALSMKRDVYSGYARLLGEEHEHTLRTAYNYALTLINLQRFEEAKSLMHEAEPRGPGASDGDSLQAGGLDGRLGV